MADARIEDLRLPATVVSRIVDKAIGSNGTVSREARTAIARAASVFILNITSYANDYALTRKRKIISPEDIFQALQVVECDQIIEPLQRELEAWRINKLHKSEEAKKRKAEKKSVAVPINQEVSSACAPSEKMCLGVPEDEDGEDNQDEDNP